MSPTPFDFLNLLVRPPGDLLYFLSVIALSQAAFFMALGQRMRRPQEHSANRYTVTTLGVVLTWAFMMFGALFALLSGREASTILPPLESAANVITILLIGWAFFTADFPARGWLSNFVLLVLVVMIINCYIFTGVQWTGIAEQTDFNLSVFGVAWMFIPAVMVLVGMLLTIAYFQKVADAPLKLVFFAVLLTGYAVTLVQMAQGVITGDYAGSVRLASLAALPILPAVIYRLVIHQLQGEVISASSGMIPIIQPVSAPTQAATITPPDGLSQAAESNRPGGQSLLTSSERESAQLMRALGMILERATPSKIPERIVNATVQVLQADIGALLVIHDANYADIHFAYDRIMQRPITGLSINLDSQPTLVNAIERRLQRPLYPDRNQDELRDIYTRLDIEQRGPTYFQPLVNDKELLAVLVIGMPYAERELTDFEQELLKGIGIISASLLALSNAAEDARARAEARIIQSMVQGVPPDELGDTSVMDAWQEMQSSLQASHEQVGELSRQVMMLKMELDSERARVATALGDTEAGMSASQQMRALTAEQQKLIEDREQLANRLREAEAALAGATAANGESVVKVLLEALRREQNELLAQRQRLENQLVEMRASGEEPAENHVQGILNRMSQERDRLESEQKQLNARLADIEAQLKALGIDSSAAGLAQVIVQLFDQRAALLHERDLLLSGRVGSGDSLEREKRLQSLQFEVSHLADDREALIKQFEQLRAERDEAVEKLDVIKQQRARMMADAASFEQELQESHDEQAGLQEKIKQLSDERSDLIDERYRLLAQLQALETERGQLLARAEGDRDRLAQLGTNGVGSLTKMIEELTVQRNQLERELNQTRANLAAVEKQVEMLNVRAGTRQEGTVTLPGDKELVVGLVQELRTPMTSMIGYVDLMLGESAGILGEAQRKFLLRVSANVTRLASMLDDLIRITTLDSGRFMLVPEPTDVIGVIEDAITNAANQLREKGLNVHLSLDDDVPQLIVDKDAITQIISELLTNAYLASPPGTDIFITARYQSINLTPNGKRGHRTEGLVVAIEDRGGGIAPEDEARVFSRKYRAENPLIQGLGDTGVGLAIAKALIEAHGGKIWLETRANLGSVFKFVLPLDPTVETEG